MDILQFLIAINYFLQFIISSQYGASLYLAITDPRLNGVKKAMVLTFASRFVHQVYYLVVLFLIFALYHLIIVNSLIYFLGIAAMTISMVMRLGIILSNNALYRSIKSYVKTKKVEDDSRSN